MILAFQISNIFTAVNSTLTFLTLIKVVCLRKKKVTGAYFILKLGLFTSHVEPQLIESITMFWECWTRYFVSDIQTSD